MTGYYRIGLDLDGVIIDHIPNKLRIAAEFGHNLSPAQASSNFMHDYLPRYEYERLKELIYGPETLTAPPVVGSLEALGRLAGETYIISARREHTRQNAWDWLSRHGVLDVIPRNRVIFVGTGSAKRPVIDDLGINVYLDDQTKVLVSLPNGVRKYLFDETGSMVKFGLNSEIRVVRGWPDFVADLDK